METKLRDDDDMAGRFGHDPALLGLAQRLTKEVFDALISKGPVDAQVPDVFYALGLAANAVATSAVTDGDKAMLDRSKGGAIRYIMLAMDQDVEVATIDNEQVAKGTLLWVPDPKDRQ
jgi:hypothetical protein